MEIINHKIEKIEYLHSAKFRVNNEHIVDVEENKIEECFKDPETDNLEWDTDNMDKKTTQPNMCGGPDACENRTYEKGRNDCERCLEYAYGPMEAGL